VAGAQLPSKRLKRNEFGSLILEEIEEGEIESSSLAIKFEKNTEKPNHRQVVIDETIPEYAFDCK